MLQEVDSKDGESPHQAYERIEIMETSSKYGEENCSENITVSNDDDAQISHLNNQAEDTEEMNESRRSKALEDFRKELQDVLKPEDDSDKYLMKFLRSSNFNLKKAAQNYRQKVFTREVYKLDTLDIWEKPEVAEKYEFNGFIGTAKDGSPVRYVHFGRGDLIGFVRSMSVFKIGIYCARIIEEDVKCLQKQNKITGEEIDGITYVIDMDDLSLLQLVHKCVIETGLDLLRMFQDHYPEIWKVIIFVNAPFYFDKAFNLFKPIMRSSLMNKIRVSSKEHSAATLLKRIDADVLPAFLGGNKLDSNGDPNCSEYLKFGGQVPPEYYTLNQPLLLQETDPEVQTRWVAARSVYNLVLVVTQPGSKLRIQFRSEKAGIGMCLMFKNFGSDPSHIEMPPTDQYFDENDEKSGVRCVSPPVIAQSHIAHIDDTAYCPWAGIYLLRLDNTYSWINGKKILYKFWVVPPSS